MVKNINSTHRIEGVDRQFSLSAARESSIENVGKGKLPSAHIAK